MNISFPIHLIITTRVNGELKSNKKQFDSFPENARTTAKGELVMDIEEGKNNYQAFFRDSSGNFITDKENAFKKFIGGKFVSY